MTSYEERMMEKEEEKKFLERMHRILPKVFSVNDDDLYRKLCIQSLNVDDSLEEILSKWGQYTEMGSPNNYPCKTWIVFTLSSYLRSAYQRFNRYFSSSIVFV